MKTVIILRGLCTLLFAAGGIYLCSMSTDGWGWCFFIVYLLGDQSYTYTCKKEE